MFDPEKVERLHRVTLMEGFPGKSTVLASDYDKLLELYREAVPKPAVMCICGHHPDAHCGPKGICTQCWQIEKRQPQMWQCCNCYGYAP